MALVRRGGYERSSSVNVELPAAGVGAGAGVGAWVPFIPEWNCCCCRPRGVMGEVQTPFSCPAWL